MQAFHPRLADLPTEIAVFPLTGALLLPRGRLPLNIFEPRYLAMTQDALGQGRLFGMVQPDARGKTGATGPGLYRIGCLGRLSSFSETDDGRLLITLIGVTRFRILEELPLAPGGYRRVRGLRGELLYSPRSAIAQRGAEGWAQAPVTGRSGGPVAYEGEGGGAHTSASISARFRAVGQALT